MADILSRSRSAPIFEARAIAMKRLRDEIVIVGKPVSYPQIGKWFGRNHSTVMSACGWIRKADKQNGKAGR